MAAESFPLLHTEQERLDALYNYHVLDTTPENSFDHIVALAIRIFNVPIAFISFIDENRIWFKASHGIAVPEMPKTTGLCSCTISGDEPVVISNALENEIASKNELVTGPMGLRFYAAAPLVVNNGYRLGTLCIADRQPREMTTDEVSILKLLGTMAAEQLELRKQARLLVTRQQDIMAHLSHELKNSISLVLGYAGLMKETAPGDETYPQYCDVILKAGNRMALLAEEALVMAANRAPVFDIKKSRVELTPLLNDAASRFMLQAKEKRQRLHVDIGTDVSIDGDAQKITEIVENLLSNAIKYSAYQKDIYLLVQLLAPGRVKIIVKDEGPGLTEFDHLKLFKPFTRLSAKPTGGESSSGMGLYIAQRLVELHDGKITAANGENGGAEFSVELPCVPV